jgi:hypothetical protein
MRTYTTRYKEDTNSYSVMQGQYVVMAGLTWLEARSLAMELNNAEETGREVWSTP